ncbi:3,4-dihydroxy-2-butanone-4-phosphate synthase [Kordiimonas sediminis]|uniref:3,4-dihydroxy-2-butanone 4-phosphate synthase n=1 Tax=Kordiimonas sediminis TaxID=1735581 RepID=A0A919AY51_9PROT|nr:3,4-dihydroxy-2-butanone-4-phosphate synthase [Kordiimonas sediminis]GHF29113.1 3,4-dihydroxy-2-butanone-4-phosphate synthase [Kordiimonas sediminis]
MPHNFLSPIEDVIEDARNGKMYILVDDEDRENEGDLIIPAQMATPEAVNFMAKYGRGLICLPMTADRIAALGLEPMSSNNQSRHETAFTVSIEAREGVSTGISAADRARTIAVAIDGSKGAADIATPGHVFPLTAKEGGVLVRAGHTEASVDISRLAGLNPSAVICEIMNDDGTMARLPDLVEFAKEHGLKVATIRDLIAYRLKYDNLIKRIAETTMRRKSGKEWNVFVYNSPADRRETVTMVLGDIQPDEPTLCRMHALNPYEDLVGIDSPRTGQLERAFKAVEDEGKGVVVLFPGMTVQRPSEQINAEPKAKTKEAALKDYGIGAQILRDVGVRKMILLSNTPSHIVGLEGYNLEIVDQRIIPAS